VLREDAAHRSAPATLVYIGGRIIYILSEAAVCATAVGAGPPQLRLTHGVAIRIVSAAVLVIVAVVGWPTSSPIVTLVLSVVVLWSVVAYDYVHGRRADVIA
jgi:hypothetical protein